MKIAIIHNRPAAHGAANWQSSQDVLQQVEAVATALQNLGIDWLSLPFDREPTKLLTAIRAEKIDAVFNLCESVADDPRLIGHPAALFELLDLPFSGSGSLALMLTTDKLLAKQLLKAAGIPTPDHRAYDGGDITPLLDLALPAIIKPRLEDASIGIDQDSMVTSHAALLEKIPLFYEQYGPLLLEQFIDGREFNISLFGYPRARVLPVAEIDFSAFPGDLHRIVGYRAKWDEDAFEYHNTGRLFPRQWPAGLEQTLHRVATAAYELFRLRDYGRIDLRLDSQGRAYVLEANANPCLSPDAGFVAAAGQDHLTFTDLVGAFVEFLHQRDRK